MSDEEIVQQFRNFLSWGARPAERRGNVASWIKRSVPPAWFAYAVGATQHCPPKGTL